MLKENRDMDHERSGNKKDFKIWTWKEYRKSGRRNIKQINKEVMETIGEERDLIHA